ncbi:pyridoxal phosphate-dependent aminotransferase [Halobium salinum]|uniref:Pyridoxal phosphate-dependent aminotransferase n=1 Tax=Halobium salinum TaxID=1364940 RepID=A0ABD5PE96_9EURY|nr:pyridoxal phosphate-dependent aminotransferase [Halobium salinum]
MLPAVPYIDWIAGKPAAATHDLGSSDLRPTTAETGVAPERLVDRPDPPAGTSLAEQVAELYGVSPECVLVTAGATHANFLAAAAALNGDDDHVLVEKPGYQPLVATPAALGATVDRFLRPPDADHAVDPDRVEGAVVDRTALVTVTNRHNPSGRRSSLESLEAAASAAAAVDAPLLVDEVYAPFGAESLDGPFGGRSAAALSNTVVTGSLTKFLGFGGVRVGWLVGPPSFVDDARGAMTHVPAVSEPSVALAARAVDGREGLCADARERLRRNHRLLAEFASGREDLSGRVHDGCSYAFLSHESADGDAVVEAAWDAGILVVPGRFFDTADAFRVSVGQSADETAAALDAFGVVLDEL